MSDRPAYYLPVAFGLVIDHPYQRRFVYDAPERRTRRELVLKTGRLLRSAAALRRKHWRLAEMHHRWRQGFDFPESP